MNQVTLVEFRKDAEKVLRRIRRGERLILTRRGKPVARLEPISGKAPREDDPIYRLAELAQDGGRSLTNRAMDREVYGL
jgi:prevent-host-death family protein